MSLPKKELPPIPEKVCFVVANIGAQGSKEREHADKVLKYLIEPACESLKYKAIRADKESVNGNINDRIINHLKNDDVVIADMTGLNANAFYEMGYRQALGLPLVPIIEANQSLPFDVVAENTVFYDTDVSKIDESISRLRNMLLDYKDFIMPNKRPKNLSEFDKINEKLDTIINQTKTSPLVFSGINREDFSNRTKPIDSVLSEKIQSQLHTPEDKK